MWLYIINCLYDTHNDWEFAHFHWKEIQIQKQKVDWICISYWYISTVYQNIGRISYWYIIIYYTKYFYVYMWRACVCGYDFRVLSFLFTHINSYYQVTVLFIYYFTLHVSVYMYHVLSLILISLLPNNHNVPHCYIHVHLYNYVNFFCMCDGVSCSCLHPYVIH